MANRTKKEKALTYACFAAARDALGQIQEIAPVQTPELYAAYGVYMETDEASAVRLDKVAQAFMRMLLQLEQRLGERGRGVKLQMAVQDVQGDERDIVFSRQQSAWEIGLSCRAGHVRRNMSFNALTDFGQEWFGRPCSAEYFDEIRGLFQEMEDLQEKGVSWKDVPNKDERFFLPFQSAVLAEMKRLDARHTGEIPAALLQSLLGTKDFYRVIAEDDQQRTRIEAANIYGTLGLGIGKTGKCKTVPCMKMPRQFYQISKRLANNIFVLAAEEGWAFSVQVSARGKVVGEMELELELVGVPQDVFVKIEKW